MYQLIKNPISHKELGIEYIRNNKREGGIIMSISKLINHYAQPYSPYMGGLINHLPMGQMALYQMNKNIEEIESYSEYFIGKFDIDLVKRVYPVVTSIEECLGKRDLYESCLAIMKDAIKDEGVDKVIRKVLNSYPYGMSSGIFHTIIRVFYAVEGANLDRELEEEVARALAYYVTGYKEAKKFHNTVNSIEFNEKMSNLIHDPHIRQLTHTEASMGQKMKALYDDKKYLNTGFIIEGNEEDKVRTLLALTLPLYDYYHNIIILHCITGLHALISLRDYFEDFTEALDIMTSCIITHLLTIEQLEIQEIDHSTIEKNWEEIIENGSSSLDVHTIKYTYSCRQLDKIYGISALKKSAINQISYK